MRATSVLTKLLDIEQTRVIGFELEEDAVVLVVKARSKRPRCGGCWRKCDRVHDRRQRRWRHLDVMGVECWLAGEVRRVRCPRCGVTTEMVPWAAPDSGFTRDFETTLAFLAQRMDKTTVTRMMRVAWETVGRVAARVVERMRVKDPLADLKHIAIDELSYKRHHHYITIVINERGDVVWAAPGRSADTLRAFFDELGEKRASTLQTVSVDLSPAFTSALKERCPNATIVYDRFHVQRLAHDALDRVRREQVRASSSTTRASAVKHTRWALHKSPWNLSDIDSAKLVRVQRTNKPLYRAYLLKETLAAIWIDDKSTSRATSSSSGSTGPSARVSPRFVASLGPSRSTSAAFSRTSAPVSRTHAQKRASAPCAPSRNGRSAFTTRTRLLASSCFAAQASRSPRRSMAPPEISVSTSSSTSDS